ncbi:MAG: Hsp20 family protein [Deltaproteobacteria bacterium]|nr:Hsp20 family protein [Deltaproteobacteria bacterium]
MTKKKGGGGEAGFGGVFKGLADLIEKLGDLADKGEQLKKSGEFQHKDVKGVYGFSVKVGLGDKGGKEVKVEPFGNVRRDEKSGETVVQEIREPVVDVFEEKDHTLVVAEMPGISTKDVHLEVQDDLLTINAEKKDKKYRKEILLPRSYPREKMKMSCNNGILEIKCVM